DYVKVREQHASKKGVKLVSLEAARANATKIAWQDYSPPKPAFLGVRELKNFPIEQLVPYIDWSPFFQTWDLWGKYPQILDDAVVGESAREVFANAQKMLDKIIKGKWLQANAVFGFWPANRAVASVDSVDVYADAASRAKVLQSFHHLRQQNEKPSGNPNQCLADFIAPIGTCDYLGGFAVTTGIGCAERAKAFEAANDDYSAIMLKALADRLAEAFAEYLHARVRRDDWGYAKDETLDTDDLTAEKYRGIRPAPGYPACPEHSEKAPLFQLLDATGAVKRAGISLTDAYAMWPTAAVSGFFYSHPQSQYFAVGKIDHDQVMDYAGRKGWSIPMAERWLAPNIG
ncbi:MAG: vitamin B12 dependent-methionine synthase activation domain-containing protein, partial [Pseudomonadota bacterium]